MDAPGTRPAERVTAIVRFSARARRMRLQVLPGKGLELVVPTGTPPKAMEAFLARHAAWAARMLRKLGAPMDAREALRPALPMQVDLPAVGEVWRVVYDEANLLPRVTKCTVVAPGGPDRRIVIHHARGRAPDPKSVFRLLKGFLRDRAKKVLPAWVDRVVAESGLPAPARVRVGVQRSVWGSRSANGTLSLSGRLLLLPPELARHVILHELCHAGHMHHRASFHRLLERHDPDSDAHSRALRKLGRTLPEWSGEG